MSTEEANYAWLSYLEEERRQREREDRDRERYPYDRHWYPDPVPDTVPRDVIPDSIVQLIPRPSHDKHLWRVAVKRGREEALAFILYSKAMKGNFKVKSVIGCVSCPGWIYVEAKNLIDVQELCDEVRDIHIRKIHQIPHEQSSSVLKETPFTYSKGGEWVRLTEPKLYRGDLGWVVQAVRGLSLDIAIVPRVVFPHPPHKRKAKGKQKADEKPIKPPRPPQRVLDMEALFQLGEPHVVGAHRWVRGRDVDGAHWSSKLTGVPKILKDEVFDLDGDAIVSSCNYRGKEYFNGFHVLTTTHYIPTIPKRAELDVFKELTIISPNILVLTEELLDAMRFSVEDPVKVIQGQAA
ncbi:hypothetical protein H0H92_010161, partial [Tricholoma furcatifolium]